MWLRMHHCSRASSAVSALTQQGEKDHARVFDSAIAFLGWTHNELHLVLRLLESVINFSSSSSRASIERCTETLLGWRSA